MYIFYSVWQIDMLPCVAKPCDSYRGNYYPDGPCLFSQIYSHSTYYINIEHIVLAPAQDVSVSDFVCLAYKLKKSSLARARSIMACRR